MPSLSFCPTMLQSLSWGEGAGCGEAPVKFRPIRSNTLMLWLHLCSLVRVAERLHNTRFLQVSDRASSCPVSFTWVDLSSMLWLLYCLYFSQFSSELHAGDRWQEILSAQDEESNLPERNWTSQTAWFRTQPVCGCWEPLSLSTRVVWTLLPFSCLSEPTTTQDGPWLFKCMEEWVFTYKTNHWGLNQTAVVVMTTTQLSSFQNVLTSSYMNKQHRLLFWSVEQCSQRYLRVVSVLCFLSEIKCKVKLNNRKQTHRTKINVERQL